MKHLNTLAATGSDGRHYTVGWWREDGRDGRRPGGRRRHALPDESTLQLPGGEWLRHLGKGAYEVPTTGVRLACSDPAAP